VHGLLSADDISRPHSDTACGVKCLFHGCLDWGGRVGLYSFACGRELGGVRDTGRSGQIQGGMGRCGEAQAVLGRYRQMQIG
jgi:hypothetical protein